MTFPPPESLGPVQIGPREIYDSVLLLRTELAGLHAELARMAAEDKSARETLTDHESRLRLLEKRVWAIPSAATVLAVASLIIGLMQQTG
ncbi:hypothetical protein [Glycomyces arizonensis]|uniref:hypothetical protein n=1 Tax=Glycomyces arizonensis TaxID=256035 RepID=UPI0012EB7027|nr:hypothetical protein [Glycomyces arizonensis]